ncbi:MAG: hypothetical protein V7K92_29535 [Nostoc sp.]
MDKRPHYTIKVYSHQPISLMFGFLPAYVLKKLKVLKRRFAKQYKIFSAIAIKAGALRPREKSNVT